MNRVHLITHKGRTVVLMDCTGLSTHAEWVAAIAEARHVVGSMPRDGSALTLTDLSDTHYNRETLQMMKELTQENRPFVKVGAIVNRSAMHRAAINMIALVSRRKFEVFETRDQALDWLVTQ